MLFLKAPFFQLTLITNGSSNSEICTVNSFKLAQKKSNDTQDRLFWKQILLPTVIEPVLALVLQ